MQPNTNTEHDDHDTSSTHPIDAALSFTFDAILGVEDDERSVQQTITFALNTTPRDQIINRYKIEKLIGDFLSNNKPRLLENMVYYLASAIFQSYPKLDHLTLTIEKPSAIANARHAFVTIAMNPKHIEPPSDQ